MEDRLDHQDDPTTTALTRIPDNDQSVIDSISPNYHPLFSSPEGDITFASKDGSMFFKIHSFVLKTASGFFRTMFSLPQRAEPQSTGIMYLEETSETLEHLLRMISGLPLLPIETWDVIDLLLDAIEKYDMPGPLSIIKLLVFTPALLNQPFRLYAVASRFGWAEETVYSSTETLSHNLYSPDIRPFLSRLSTGALLSLFELHRRRRDGMHTCLNSPPFVSGATSNCANCVTPIDYHTWRELKYKIIMEMDARPLGDTVVEHGLLEWPEANACWTAKCPHSGCQRSLYDKAETVRVIRECLDTLPKSVTNLPL